MYTVLGPSPLESRPACPSPCSQGRQSPWLPTADLRWPNLRPCLLPGPSPSLGPATHSWPPSRKEGESLRHPPQPMSPGPGDLTSHLRSEPRPGVGTPPYKCSQTQAAWPEPWAWTGSSRWGEDWLGPAWAEWQGPRESRGHLSTAHVLTAWLLGTWPPLEGLTSCGQASAGLCVLLQLLLAVPVGCLLAGSRLLRGPPHPGL